MKKAVIITENKYPHGDAGAVRQHSFAKMFEELGFSVIVLGYGESTNGKFENYDGIDYISFRSKSNNTFIRLVNRLLFGFRVFTCLKRNACDSNVIMVVDTLPYAFKLIKRFAKKHNAVLIHDSVEWYSPEEFSNGEKNIQYKLKEKTNCSIISKDWRVVAISKYLYAHFSKKCTMAVRIPVVMDVQSIPFSVNTSNSKNKFVYAGTPGLKDHLKEIVVGFSMLSEEQKKKVELHIIGVSKQQLCDVCGVDSQILDGLGAVLRVHGRISRDEVIEEVRNADYTLMLRSSELRYAKAGFPTKIVESFACGTPPICNISSDLADYLKDGENSVIIEGQTSNDVKNAVLKAIFYKESGKNLRNAARKTAEDCFDYRCYIDELRRLLKD